MNITLLAWLATGQLLIVVQALRGLSAAISSLPNALGGMRIRTRKRDHPLWVGREVLPSGPCAADKQNLSRTNEMERVVSCEINGRQCFRSDVYLFPLVTIRSKSEFPHMP